MKTLKAVSKNYFSYFTVFLDVLILSSVYLLFFQKQAINSELGRNFIVTILISSFLLSLERLFSAYQAYERFHFLEGEYDCYSYLDEDKEPDNFEKHTKLKDGANGKANIKYLKDNILMLILKNGSNMCWQGDLVMHLERSGVITWRYIKLNDVILGDKVHVNGFKRCSVWTDKKEKIVWIYLYSDGDNRYGREVLKKKK